MFIFYRKILVKLKKHRHNFFAVSAYFLMSYQAVAVVYPLPAANSSLLGKNIQITVPEDNKLSLEAFSAQYQMGLSNMIEANPGVDVYLPASGSTLIIPQQLILPKTPREGIIINSAEMRLYYYPKGRNQVIVLPIGIGEPGKTTPVNWITSIQGKKANPTWTPPPGIRAEYEARGEHLPAVFPAGPNNPMGLFSLYLPKMFAIHGTNANFGIGLRVSHGCVRLRNDDIEWLFNNVPVGTRVQFINEPVKATIEPDGSRYVEVHNPLSETEEELNAGKKLPITLTPEVRNMVSASGVDESRLKAAIDGRSGVPVKIN